MGQKRPGDGSNDGESGQKSGRQQNWPEFIACLAERNNDLALREARAPDGRGPRHKIAETTPCKVEWAARCARRAPTAGRSTDVRAEKKTPPPRRETALV